MSYAVHSIFLTLQGEGVHSGRPAVFLRFSGCNLWSGREADRATATCQFCDTDFVGTEGVGGGRYADAESLAQAVAERWPWETSGRSRPYVVCTGGEPLLQVDEDLIAALHERGFEIAVETNGTRAVPPGVDWLCVSPKAGAPLVVTRGDELKVVYPQAGQDLEKLETLDFQHFFLQPMDGPHRKENTREALQVCLRRPQWRLSLQTHKVLGIP